LPKTTVTLPSGTVITVDGTVEDIERIISAATASTVMGSGREQVSRMQTSSSVAPDKQTDEPVESELNLVELVHLAKTCNEAESIAKHVLDKRSVVNKILLPLYLVHEHKSNSHGLTSGQISRVLKELGTPIDVRNVSTSLSGQARGFVTGDKVRVRGQAVSYKMIRRGVQYFKETLAQKT
jgi:hypothetical protein